MFKKPKFMTKRKLYIVKKNNYQWFQIPIVNKYFSMNLNRLKMWHGDLILYSAFAS